MILEAWHWTHGKNHRDNSIHLSPTPTPKFYTAKSFSKVGQYALRYVPNFKKSPTSDIVGVPGASNVVMPLSVTVTISFPWLWSKIIVLSLFHFSFGSWKGTIKYVFHFQQKLIWKLGSLLSNWYNVFFYRRLDKSTFKYFKIVC